MLPIFLYNLCSMSKKENDGEKFRAYELAAKHGPNSAGPSLSPAPSLSPSLQVAKVLKQVVSPTPKPKPTPVPALTPSAVPTRIETRSPQFLANSRVFAYLFGAKTYKVSLFFDTANEQVRDFISAFSCCQKDRRACQQYIAFLPEVSDKETVSNNHFVKLEGEFQNYVVQIPSGERKSAYFFAKNGQLIPKESQLVGGVLWPKSKLEKRKEPIIQFNSDLMITQIAQDENESNSEKFKQTMHIINNRCLF